MTDFMERWEKHKDGQKWHRSVKKDVEGADQWSGPGRGGRMDKWDHKPGTAEKDVLKIYIGFFILSTGPNM